MIDLTVIPPYPLDGDDYHCCKAPGFNTEKEFSLWLRKALGDCSAIIVFNTQTEGQKLILPVEVARKCRYLITYEDGENSND